MAASEGAAMKSRLEFAVQMTCESCAKAVRNALQGVNGIDSVQIDVQQEQVVVDTTLTSGEVQALIEGTGRRVLLRGMGPSSLRDLGAAVAMLGPERGVSGAVRFLQLSEQQCIIEGTVDGLSPGRHGLHVHAPCLFLGDLTDSCHSCGGHYNPGKKKHGGPVDKERHLGDLGNILANELGRATFRMQNDRLKVKDIIGRSIAVNSGEDDLGRGGHPLSRITGNSGESLVCGIIARSSGLFQNTKKFCACDGVTLWDERQLPTGGKPPPSPHLKPPLPLRPIPPHPPAPHPLHSPTHPRPRLLPSPLLPPPLPDCDSPP
ncbi:copper chaperone for superoxide dismutase-like, partial [Leucoraja erinacea]|uniref:copper chaperone for superoxide dismutase-like n=1 Tax=Leucoraja erinaceus TaxID=7782 RepID=UPI002457D109